MPDVYDLIIGFILLVGFGAAGAGLLVMLDVGAFHWWKWSRRRRYWRDHPIQNSFRYKVKR